MSHSSKTKAKAKAQIWTLSVTLSPSPGPFAGGSAEPVFNRTFTVELSALTAYQQTKGHPGLASVTLFDPELTVISSWFRKAAPIGVKGDDGITRYQPEGKSKGFNAYNSPESMGL